MGREDKQEHDVKRDDDTLLRAVPALYRYLQKLDDFGGYEKTRRHLPVPEAQATRRLLRGAVALHNKSLLQSLDASNAH